MKINKTVKSADGKITLTHHQTLRQSLNYQSAEASYGASIVVTNSPKMVKLATRRLEEIVESAIAVKFSEQREVLKAMPNER